MNKTRERELTQWLKAQVVTAKPWLTASKILSIFTGVVIVAQAWLLSSILHELIISHTPRVHLKSLFLLLLFTILAKASLNWLREWCGFNAGKIIRLTMRSKILNKLENQGPAWIQEKPIGSWVTIIQEQIEEMQDYYARYLPQISLSMSVPLVIVIAIFPINWAAGVILLITAPLVPLFMILVGLGAAEANRRNFVALRRLMGNFFDLLRGLDTLRVFNRGEAEIHNMKNTTEEFRRRTMEVLKLAFLSSAVLEFFASVSIAVVALYFGFSYLGEFHFGSYGVAVSLSAGFFALILAPEFFQPLRDLGTFYHAKAQAIGAAEAIVEFLASEPQKITHGTSPLPQRKAVTITAKQLVIFSTQGERLVGPLDFTLPANKRIAVVGASGAGKSSLIHVLLGFLPYTGSLTINGVELSTISTEDWRAHLGWIGQNPHLPEQSLRENVLLGSANVSEEQLSTVLKQAHVEEFIDTFPQGLKTIIGDDAIRLSVGQAQRIALARLLLKPSQLLLLDEPTASLDATSEQYVMKNLLLLAQQQTTLWVTHRLRDMQIFDEIWVMAQGYLLQQGTYHELSQQKEGAFYQLLQHHNEEL